jgi:hypothetical protein
VSTALRLLVLALGLVGTSSASAAYNTPQPPAVLVKVRDVTQAPVPDAYVKLFPATGKAVPTGDGTFLFTVDAGRYDLFVEAMGFREVAKRIEVRDGEPTVVYVELRVGSCAGCVTVSSYDGREAVSIPVISITEEASHRSAQYRKDELNSLKRHVVPSTGPESDQQKSYSGFLLAELLAKFCSVGACGGGADEGQRRYIVASGDTGCFVYPLARLIRENAAEKIIVADAVDGKPLPQNTLMLVLIENSRVTESVRGTVGLGLRLVSIP